MAAFFRTFLLLCLIPFSAFADEGGVRSFADGLAKQALDIAASAEMSTAQKQDELELLFEENVDMAWVGRFVLGKHWRNADDSQQQQYLENYKAFLLKNYASRLTDYSGESYAITNVREEKPGEYMLSMKLTVPGEPNVAIDYRIREESGNYKVYDIVVEGVSMITTQRSEFNSVVNNKGLDFLIEALGKKAAAKS